MYTNGYDIDSYLTECSKMDLIDVIDYTQKELFRLHSMHPPKDAYIKYKFFEYRDFLGDFAGFLGGAPIKIIAGYYKNKVKPVIQHFVSKDQLSESVLKLFE